MSVSYPHTNPYAAAPMANPPGIPAHGATQVSLAMMPTPIAGKNVRKAARRRSASNRTRRG